MRNTFLLLAASTFLAMFVGCACNNCGSPCKACQGKAAGQGQQQAQQAGPGGVVSYPYYTLRGPRDFLVTHPQSTGP
jgi:hypothetical protein